MLTKEKMLYQVKLIIDCLSDYEYMKISQDTIRYIEDNYEYDENIKIDPKIPLEEQNIDRATLRFLEKIVSEINENKGTEIDRLFEETYNEDTDIKDVKKQNIELKELVQSFKEENSKIPKIKTLLNDYKIQFENVNNKLEILENQNNLLIKSLNKIPKFIRKIFLKKQDIKLLNESSSIR